MKSYFKPWEELKFTDDYMFCKIMKDEGICKAVVETILNIKMPITKIAIQKNGFFDASIAHTFI